MLLHLILPIIALLLLYFSLALLFNMVLDKILAINTIAVTLIKLG